MIGRLNDEQIEEVLCSNEFGRIGCGDHERVYAVPVNYMYDGKYIIAHSVIGMKIAMMRNNPKVCHEVDEVTSFTNRKSVIVWEEYQELTMNGSDMLR